MDDGNNLTGKSYHPHYPLYAANCGVVMAHAIFKQNGLLILVLPLEANWSLGTVICHLIFKKFGKIYRFVRLLIRF